MKKRMFSFSLLFFTSHVGAMLPSFHESFENAAAYSRENRLVVSTGAVSAEWICTDNGLALTELTDKSGKAWQFSPGTGSDWYIPGVTEGVARLKLLSAREHDDEGFTTKHLEVVVEFSYPKTKTSVQYRIWAYPDAFGIRTQLWLKARQGFRIPEDQPEGTLLRLSTDVSGHTRRAAIYSKYNSARGNRYEQFPMMREMVNQGAISTTEVYDKAALLVMESSAGSLILVKEAPVVDSAVRIDKRYQHVAWKPYRTGGFKVSADAVFVTGAGITASDLESQWLQAWATWIVLAKPGIDAAQLAVKRFDRKRFPFHWKHEWYIGANNWGSTPNPYLGQISSMESSILVEIKAAGEMGIEMVQIDDGWQKEKTSQLDPSVYPEGWKNVKTLAEEKGVKLGLWMGWAQQVSTPYLIKELNAGGFNAVKLDFYNVSTYQGVQRLRDIARQIHTQVEQPLIINWDITGVQAKDQGFFYGREYGNLWLENQKQHLPDHTLYRPWRVLRDVWEVSHYVNLDQIQIAIQNPDREYEGNSDASEHSQGYCVAIGLMGSPNFFQELKYLKPHARTEIKGLLNIYKKVRPQMAEGIVYPIGHRPDNAQWTGFQNYNENTGISYLMIFRERLNKNSSAKLPLCFYQSQSRLHLTDLISGKTRDVILDNRSQIEFFIPETPGFQFLEVLPKK